MQRINKNNFINRGNQQSNVSYGNSSEYETKIEWNTFSPEQLRFIVKKIDGGKISRLINGWSYTNGVSKTNNREWHSFAVRYYKTIFASRTYGKNYFCGEWWLGHGEATPKENCPYCIPFGDGGNDDWVEFIELFGLDHLAYKGIELIDEDEGLDELKRLEEIQLNAQRKMESLKRRLSSKDNSMYEPKEKKLINNNRGSIIAKTLEKARILGTITNEDDDHVLDMQDGAILDDPKCLKEVRLNKNLEGFIERESRKGSRQEQLKENEKSKEFEKKLGKRIELRRDHDDLEEEEEH